MPDFGNIAGVVKSFVEPQQSDGSPKRFVIWAKEKSPGSNQVDLLAYNFIQSRWENLIKTNAVFKADIVHDKNISDLTIGISQLDNNTLQNGSRVLLIGQTQRSENGLYEFDNTAGALNRPVEFQGAISANHIVYVFKGSYIGRIIRSKNLGNALFTNIDVDGLDYDSGIQGGVVAESSPRQCVVLNTNDANATINNYLARLVTVINALPEFEILSNQDFKIKHIYQTPPIEATSTKVLRIAWFRLNVNNGQTLYGAGNDPITLANLIPVSDTIIDRVRHPDEIALNGMGGYDFGNPTYDIIEGDNKSQHDFNKAAASLIKSLAAGSRFEIQGSTFEYRPILGNDGTSFQIGDLALNGWLAQNRFGKILSYNGGDATLFTGWDIVESI